MLCSQKACDQRGTVCITNSRGRSSTNGSAADTGASAVVEGVRRVGHPPLAARDEAFRSREPPPLPCPHVERRAGRWARVGGIGPIVRGRAGAGQCAVAFSGDQRQQEESQEEEKPSLTARARCAAQLPRRDGGGNGWGRETRLVRVFFGRKGLMASAAPCLHVLAFWADSCWVVACQSPVWLDCLRH